MFPPAMPGRQGKDGQDEMNYEAETVVELDPFLLNNTFDSLHFVSNGLINTHDCKPRDQRALMRYLCDPLTVQNIHANPSSTIAQTLSFEDSGVELERYRYVPTVNGRFQITHDSGVIANPAAGEEQVFDDPGSGVYSKPWVFNNVLEPKEKIKVYRTAAELSIAMWVGLGTPAATMATAISHRVELV